MNWGSPRVSMRYIMTIFICESWKAAFAGNPFTVTPQRVLLFTFLWGRRRSWALLSLPSFSGSLHHFERVRDKSALGCHGDRSTAETHLCNGFLLKRWKISHKKLSCELTITPWCDKGRQCDAFNCQSVTEQHFLQMKKKTLEPNDWILYLFTN